MTLAEIKQLLNQLRLVWVVIVYDATIKRDLSLPFEGCNNVANIS